jgi:hypothetical protein
MLEYLRVTNDLVREQNLNGACVAVNPAFDRCRQLIMRWRELALVRECIAPEGSNRTNHRQDQSLLTVLAYQAGLAQRVFPSYVGFRVHCDIDDAATFPAADA